METTLQISLKIRRDFERWYSFLRTETPITEAEIKALAYRLYQAGRTDATQQALALLDAKISQLTNDAIDRGVH